ncbi:MAG: hypothetical protein VB068_13375, partial [Petrimonas sp.]|nr:hypothetical protein [Petrimonas sp.]
MKQLDNILWIVVFIVLMVSLVGCSDGFKSSSSKEAALIAKLQPFIICLNRTDLSLQESAKNYRTLFSEVAKDPESDHFMMPFSGFKSTPSETDNEFSRQCVSDLRKATEQLPRNPVLDPLDRDYAKTLETMIPVMNDI